MKKKGPFGKSFLIFFNPVIAIVYGILCFEVYKLAMYGDVNKRAPMIIAAVVFLVIWLLFFVFIISKLGKNRSEDKETQITWIENEKKIKTGKNGIWISIMATMMLVILLGITGAEAYGLYYSAIPYNGKLSWEIESLHNKRELTFSHNDMQKYGVSGIFKDLDTSLKMPKNLYLAGNLDFSYSKEGKITAFDAFVYGKNKEKQTQSYLISYNSKKNDKITVYLNNKVSDTYDASKSMEPFFHIMKALPLSEATNGWDESDYSVLYRGKRNWGYDATGIFMLNQDGSIQQASKDAVPVIGYSVSVYIKGKESSVTPRRYVASWEKEDMYQTKESETESAAQKIKVVTDTGVSTQTSGK